MTDDPGSLMPLARSVVGGIIGLMTLTIPIMAVSNNNIILYDYGQVSNLQ